MKLDEIAQDQREHGKALAQEHAGTVHAVGSESLSHKRYPKRRFSSAGGGKPS